MRTQKESLRRLILQVERVVRENWSGEMDGELWPAYEEARAAIGEPVRTFPGHDTFSHHIHFLDHEEGTCRWCDEQDDECDICEERKALSLEEEEETR